MRDVDEEIQRLLNEAHEKTLELLRGRKDVLDRVSEALVERETIDGDELQLLVEGKPLPPIERAFVPPADTPPPEKRDPVKGMKPKIDLSGPQPQPST